MAQMAAPFSDGQAASSAETYIELEHAIGLNVECYKPVHYVSSERQKQHDYLSICGSSIVLSSFSDAHSQTFLRGHTAAISGCVVSPDKELIATSQSGTSPDVVVWRNGKMHYKLEEHNKTVRCMAFSDDSRFLATVGGVGDDKMFVWDMLSGYIVTSAVSNPSPCWDIAWGGRVKDVKRRQTTDYLFATCGVEQVRVWAMTPSSGQLLSEKCSTAKVQSSRRTFSCIAFSHTADLLVAGTTSGDFFIFDVRRMTALTSYRANAVGGISCVRCCKLRGQHIHDPLDAHFFVRIMVGCGDGSVSIWRYDDDLERFIEGRHSRVDEHGAIHCLDLSGDDDKLLVAATTGNIYEMEVDPQSNTQRVGGHHSRHPLGGGVSGQQQQQRQREGIRAISYHETSSIVDVQFIDSNAVVTVSEGGSIRKWSMEDYSVMLSHHKKRGKSGNVKSVCFDLNDEVIITGGSDGAIRAFNANASADGVLWAINDAHGDGVGSIRLGYNGKYIISGGVAGGLRVWDIRFKKLVAHLKEHTAAINAIELYSDSRHAITCSKDRSFICWDLQSQKRISCHRIGRMATINDLELTPDEATVITVGADRAITFWDIRQSKPRQKVDNAHAADINCIRIGNSSNGRNTMIATADIGSTIKLWDLNTLRPIQQHNAFCGKINGIAFSADNKQMVSAGDDGTIMLWNIFEM